MGKPVKQDYSKQFGNDGRILTRILENAEGVDYLGYIAYALYKVEKNTELDNYKTAHPTATDSDIQDQKDYFRFSHCTKKNIDRYLKEAIELDNQMYEKKLEAFIEGFENGAEGERAHLEDDLIKLMSEKIGTAIDSKYKLEKKSNYLRGVFQSFWGTLIWILLTIVVGLYVKYGKNADTTNSNYKESIELQKTTDTINTEREKKLTVDYSQGIIYVATQKHYVDVCKNTKKA